MGPSEVVPGIIAKRGGDKEGDDPCCFEDAADMSMGRAKCCRHHKMCTVLGIMILLAGFSCKDLSTAKAQDNEKRSCELESGTGTAATTFAALLAFLQETQTPIYIGENVDEVATPESINRMVLIERFAEIGYDLCILHVRSPVFAPASNLLNR